MMFLAMTVTGKYMLFLFAMLAAFLSSYFIMASSPTSRRGLIAAFVSLGSFGLILVHLWVGGAVLEGSYGIKQDQVIEPGFHFLQGRPIPIPQEANWSFAVLEKGALEISFRVKNPDALKGLYPDLKPHVDGPRISETVYKWMAESLKDASDEASLGEKANALLKRMREGGIEADATFYRSVEAGRFSNHM